MDVGFLGASLNSIFLVSDAKSTFSVTVAGMVGAEMTSTGVASTTADEEEEDAEGVVRLRVVAPTTRKLAVLGPLNLNTWTVPYLIGK